MRQRTVLVALAFAGCLVASDVMAASPRPGRPPFLPVNVPFTDQDPVMDGKATSLAEWEDALVVPDSFFFGTAWRAGFYYFEAKMDWEATSVVAENTTTYPGQTTFVAHDIIGSPDTRNFLHQFRLDEDWDWNSFEFPTPGGKTTIWVFDDTDETDDTTWLLSSEGLHLSPLLAPGTDLNKLDDRGFIARLNDDPSTDVQWMEGMPEPGDAGWDWEDFHWVFGRHTFGQSFQDVGLDPDPENEVDHEVYEFCAYRPDWTRDPPEDPPPPPWCIWWGFKTITVIVPKWIFYTKDGVRRVRRARVAVQKRVPVLKGQFWLHFWEPERPVGPPDLAQHVGIIQNQIQQVAQELGEQGETNAEALQRLNLAAGSLDNAAFTGLLEGNRGVLFRDMRRFFRHLRASRRRRQGMPGVPPAEIVDVEMQALSLVGQAPLDTMVELDRAGVGVDDRDLLRAMRGMYGFGGRLNGIGRRGFRANYIGALNRLRRVFKFVDRVSQREGLER